MDGLSFTGVCILVHDSDHWSALSDNDTATSDDRYVNNLVIVNASDINMSTSLEDDAYVVASDSTVGAAVDECSGLARSVGRNGVSDGYVHRAVFLAVDNEIFRISGFLWWCTCARITSHR